MKYFYFILSVFVIFLKFQLNFAKLIQPRIINYNSISSEIFSDSNSKAEDQKDYSNFEINSIFGENENPDAHLTTPELIEKYGFPAESHEVTTEDGYILTLHRIPHGNLISNEVYNYSPGFRNYQKNYKNLKKSDRKPAVFLQHGLTSSSSDWIMNTVEKALPYKLANAGYDVWLGNARGNMYSQKHLNLSTNSYRYWRFSWNEMGQFDVPAVIDYILEKTQQKSLYYIGHSMGTTMFWTMLSHRPEYAKKVRFFAGLGPAVYLSRETGIVKTLSKFSFEEQIFLDMVGHGQLMPSILYDMMIKFDPKFCDVKMQALNICENVIFLISGFDSNQMNLTQLPVIVGHTPAPTSSRSLIHYLQMIKSGLFRQYDYGRWGNSLIYGQEEPPSYDLKKANVPTAIFWGENDQLCDPKDVAQLVSELPNVVSYFKVNLTDFNHVDFIFAIDADKLVYDPLMELMKKY